MQAFARLTAAEMRLFLREPVAVFFAVAFPALLVGVLGSVRSFRDPSPDLGGARVIDLYVPIAVTLVIGMLGLQVTPQVLAGYREQGILRRLSTTPVGPARLLGAQLVTSLAVGLLAVALVLTVGRVAFSVRLPRQPAAYTVALVLTVAAVFGIGLFIAAVVKSAKTGNAVGVVLFFPVMFFAGLWAPRESMPPLVRRIGDFTPLGAAEQALRDASTGSWPHLGQLAVLVAYIVVFGAAAARFFRWE